MRSAATLTLTQGAAKVCTLVENRQPSRTPRRDGQASGGGGWLPGISAFLVCATAISAHAVELSRGEAARIGKRVWQNECAGTISGLTSWNAGENFASLGIGHFIWYPKGVRGPFAESFPDFVAYAAQAGTKLPQAVEANRQSGCPWATRAEFLAASKSAPMAELRQFLVRTVDLQAQFLVQRLQQALPKMLAQTKAGDGAHLRRQFDRVASTSQGCYALVDYVNFKGEGVLDSERYGGQGWGLLQVLSGMNGQEAGLAAAQEFSASARRVLTRRVENSPPARAEARWLPGWLQRVSGYAEK
ncbi:MAG: hypothetical protein ACR2ID_07455 [Chthoniobacterales bacterium]